MWPFFIPQGTTAHESRFAHHVPHPSFSSAPKNPSPPTKTRSPSLPCLTPTSTCPSKAPCKTFLLPSTRLKPTSSPRPNGSIKSPAPEVSARPRPSSSSSPSIRATRPPRSGTVSGCRKGKGGLAGKFPMAFGRGDSLGLSERRSRPEAQTGATAADDYFPPGLRPFASRTK